MNEIEQAKKVLKEAGYYVDILWSIEDVQAKFKCTNEMAQQVLDRALNDEPTMEQIWYSIDFEAEELNLERC